jgi:hypothetical protein
VISKRYHINACAQQFFCVGSADSMNVGCIFSVCYYEVNAEGTSLRPKILTEIGDRFCANDVADCENFHFSVFLFLLFKYEQGRYRPCSIIF